MKNITRKSLIKKLSCLHANTKIDEVNERFLLESFIGDLSAGYFNIHDAARMIKEKGFAI